MASVTSEEIIQIEFCGVCLTGFYSWMGVQATGGWPISIKKTFYVSHVAL